MNARVSSIFRAKKSPQPATKLAPRFRCLHLAPPFLLDDYTPRYQTLSSRDEAKKRSLAYAHLRNCNLCPRLCGVNRYEKTGMCLIGDKVKVNVIAPHFGEGLIFLILRKRHSKSLATQFTSPSLVPPYHHPQPRIGFLNQALTFLFFSIQSRASRATVAVAQYL